MVNKRQSKIVMVPGQNFLPQVRSAIFGLGLENFSIFFPNGKKILTTLGQKVPASEPGQPLIYCGSKVCLGRVGLGRNGLGRVGSGPISRL